MNDGLVWPEFATTDPTGLAVSYSFGAERRTMTPYHVEMHPPGVDGVAAEAARHSTGRLSYRLFQQ